MGWFKIRQPLYTITVNFSIDCFYFMGFGSVLTLHDLFTIKGGGERLVKILCDSLDADLITGHLGKDGFDISELTGKVTNLNALNRIHGIKTWRLAQAFKKIKLNQFYDNVIYSGVASPLARGTIKATQHLFYCHTPPRFIYDKKDYYASKLSWPARSAFTLLNAWFRPQYEQAVRGMDVVFTNAEYVRQRIKTYLGVDAHVIHPPCDTKYFRWLGTGDYYLSTARLDGLKRVDAIINAFKEMPDKKLIIASGGDQANQLQQLALGYDNIIFTGWLSERKMLDLIGYCIATIYVPEDEDFGMSPVESMAAGKPVICSDHGGPLETVVDRETGFYVGGDLSQQIITAVNKLDATTASTMRTACEKRAKAFDSEQFIKRISKFLI